MLHLLHSGEQENSMKHLKGLLTVLCSRHVFQISSENRVCSEPNLFSQGIIPLFVSEEYDSQWTVMNNDLYNHSLY